MTRALFDKLQERHDSMLPPDFYYEPLCKHCDDTGCGECDDGEDQTTGTNNG